MNASWIVECCVGPPAVLPILVDNVFYVPVFILCVPSYQTSAVLALAEVSGIRSCEFGDSRCHVSPVIQADGILIQIFEFGTNRMLSVVCGVVLRPFDLKSSEISAHGT